MIDGTEKPKIPSKFAIRAARYNEFRCNNTYHLAYSYGLSQIISPSLNTQGEGSSSDNYSGGTLMYGVERHLPPDRVWLLISGLDP